MKNIITILFILSIARVFSLEPVKMTIQDVITKEYLAAGPNVEIDGIKWSYQKEEKTL